jgi:hypothetical protein
VENWAKLWKAPEGCMKEIAANPRGSRLSRQKRFLRLRGCKKSESVENFLIFVENNGMKLKDYSRAPN